MLLPRYVLCALSVGMMVLVADSASGQNYPNKPIRIVTAEPGASTDMVARLIGQGLSASLGQHAVIDNRGGNVVIPAGIVAKAPPDGYTLLVFINALWLVPLLQDNVPYDPVRDFSPITLAASTPNMVVVHPSLPVKSVKELIALAKAKPGELSYASGITGAINHLAGELFNVMAGVNIVRVPYKGASLAVNDLIGGHLQVMFATAASVMPHLKSGRLRALAVCSAEPSALAPGLPTVAASGLPGFESVSVVAIFAPAKTPKAIVELLNQEIVQVLNKADVKEKFFRLGIETSGSSPERLAAMMKAERARMGKVIKDVGIRAESKGKRTPLFIVRL